MAQGMCGVVCNEVCRGTGFTDRRAQIMEEIRQIIDEVGMGREPQKVNKGDVGGPCRDRKGVSNSCRASRMRNVNKDCLQFRKRRDCTPPTITSIAVHEIRPTNDYSRMQNASTKDVTFVDAISRTEPWKPMPPAPWELPRNPSQELRMGVLYKECDCTKRNGLQHDCQRWDCNGRPECVASNPGPCCPTSAARKPHRGDRRNPCPTKPIKGGGRSGNGREEPYGAATGEFRSPQECKTECMAQCRDIEAKMDGPVDLGGAPGTSHAAPMKLAPRNCVLDNSARSGVQIVQGGWEGVKIPKQLPPPMPQSSGQIPGGAELVCVCAVTGSD